MYHKALVSNMQTNVSLVDEIKQFVCDRIHKNIHTWHSGTHTFNCSRIGLNNTNESRFSYNIIEMQLWNFAASVGRI